jgi:predicted MPP superfamily phosphohydrolase
LEDEGITVLEDETQIVPLGSARLTITGVTNIYRRRPSRDILERAMEGRDARALALFLTHQPTVDLVHWAAEREYDLFLAGHTHGGQVVFNYFGYRACISNRETSFVSGFFRVGSMLVSVTNGLGLTLAPVRFHAPAEITLIRVIPHAPAGSR